MTADTPVAAAPDPVEYSFLEREVLVAISHRDIVRSVLDELGAQSAVIDEDPDLGLTRLELGATREGLELNALWDLLYTTFEQRYDGWRPTIGKNRIVGPVVGSGQLSWGGEGAPKPVERPATWPPARSGAGRGARVAVLDTAAVTQSPLDDGWLDRYSDVHPLTEGAQPVFAGHATFVAGLVLSRAPAATVEVRRVLDSERGEAYAWDVAKAIVAADRAGADVINLSLVCYTKDGEAPMALQHAIAQVGPETVVVAAAGNYGNHPDEQLQRRPTWPAALPSVIAVGASTNDGKTAPFTPQNVPWIDLNTSGVDLDSTFLRGRLQPAQEYGEEPTFDGFARWSGTSFAAALFSGAIAAGIRPGRTSARASLAALLAASRGRGGEPPFLSLLPTS